MISYLQTFLPKTGVLDSNYIIAKSLSNLSQNFKLRHQTFLPKTGVLDSNYIIAKSLSNLSQNFN